MKSPLQILGGLLSTLWRESEEQGEGEGEGEIVFWSFLPYSGDIFSSTLNCHAHALVAKKAEKGRMETSLTSGRLFKQYLVAKMIKKKDPWY